MLNVLAREDEGDAVWTPSRFASWDSVDTHFDPPRDRIIAMVDDKIIGVGRVKAEVNLVGERVFMHSFNLLPQWRRKGIGRAVLHHNERRLREIAAKQPPIGPGFFDTYGIPDCHIAEPLMQQEGYAPFRYF